MDGFNLFCSNSAMVSPLTGEGIQLQQDVQYIDKENESPTSG